MRLRLAALFLLAAPAALEQAAANYSPFASIPPAVPDTLRFGAPIPAFESKDIDGHTWTLDDFRGKYTLVYIWNSGEARIVDAHGQRIRETVHGFSDLPAVERFYTKWKSDKVIQVLTLCTDYDYTHAPAYRKEAGYTFPVLNDFKIVRKFFPPEDGWRQYAVVNPEGRLSLPFRSWTLGRVLFEIERAAGRN